MSENTFADSTVNQHADEKLTNVNNFVFTNNKEFVDFQRCFVMNDKAPFEPVFDKKNLDTKFEFFASDICDHISLTFMYNGGEPYQIINNKAFFLKGFKKIVIQGARSKRTNKRDIPTLEVYKEGKDSVNPNLDSNDNPCHSYGCDDAIFNIQNEHSNPADIVISDIAFRVAFRLEDVISPLGNSSTADPKVLTNSTTRSKSIVAETGSTDVVKNEGYLYKHWYHPDICPVFFKVYEASSFKMFNVRMYSQYLDLTHVFLHWCENVDITNCEFKNYNARKIGGNIWICQRVKNVNIVNNDFYKYGNDENIGIWGDSIMSRDENGYYSSKDTLSGLDSDEYANRQLKFEHIHIKNNRFFYGKPEKSPYTGEDFPDFINLDLIHKAQKEKYEGKTSEDEWNGVIDIFQNLYFSQHTPKMGTQFANEEYAIVPYVHYEVSDYVTSGNEFYIDSPMNVLMGVTFDNYCHTEGIKITNNLIKYGPWAHGECQLQDFKVVYDKNPDLKEAVYDLEMTNKKCLTPILIEDNTIESSAFPYMSYSDTACETHIVLDVESGSVEFNRNIVNEDHREVNKTIKNHTKDDDAFKEIPFSADFGYMLLYSRDKGGSITMRDNVFRGMLAMGSFDFTEPAEAAEKGDKSAKENKSFIHLYASGNVFQGKTWFNSKNLKEGVFDFRRNKFFAECAQLILNELPERSLLTLTDNVFRRKVDYGSGDGLLYYHDAEKPIGNPRLTVVSSGNKFVNIAGHICDYYNGADIEIYSSDEVCLDDDYYEAKSEYYEDH